MRYDFDDFYVENNIIYIKKHVKAAKPITGTKIGAITGDNPWSSPFVIFMDMYRFTIPFEMTLEMQKGIDYEPFVIKGINKLYNTNFEDYSPNPYYDWPLEEIGKKFNGKIDGWDSNKSIVLECKVTGQKNLSKWIKNQPPKYYLLQMLLYAKLAKASEVWLSGYFLNQQDYDSEAKNIDPKKLRVWKYKFDNAQSKLLEDKLTIVDKFVKKHIKTRISPKFDPSKKCDREVLDYFNIPYKK